MELIKKLQNIQGALKAPKNQYNEFGKFSYRNCEDILEALKPHLFSNGVILTINDEIVNINERFYVKSTAIITDGTNKIEVSAFAREAESKKGMDEAQVTGAASSYARKYALNGLFCIDDTKDPDTKNNTENDKKEGSKSEHPKTDNKNKCPKCGKNTTVGALNNWGMCAECKKGNN